MNDNKNVITTLHPNGRNDVNIYPNILMDNLPKDLVNSIDAFTGKLKLLEALANALRNELNKANTEILALRGELDKANVDIANMKEFYNSLAQTFRR